MPVDEDKIQAVLQQLETSLRRVQADLWRLHKAEIILEERIIFLNRMLREAGGQPGAAGEQAS